MDGHRSEFSEYRIRLIDLLSPDSPFRKILLITHFKNVATTFQGRGHESKASWLNFLVDFVFLRVHSGFKKSELIEKYCPDVRYKLLNF